MLIFFIIFKII